MDLKIRTSPKGKWTDITLDKPANLEEIIHIYKDRTGERPPYIYLCAKVNNSLRELDFIIDKDWLRKCSLCSSEHLGAGMYLLQQGHVQRKRSKCSNGFCHIHRSL